MLPGQLIQPGDTLYSPWFPRGGDYGVFRAQLIDKAGSGTPDVDITFYQKNVEDTGNGTVIPSMTIDLTDADAVGEVVKLDVTTGFKELVRLKFACTGAWMRFRMLDPSWYDKAGV